MEIYDKENILERLTRLLLTAKRKMIIKKLTWNKPVTLEISLYGSQEKSFEKTVEDLKMFSKECDWLITNYVNKPHISTMKRGLQPLVNGIGSGINMRSLSLA